MATLGSSSSRTAGAPAQPKPSARPVREQAAAKAVSSTPTPYAPVRNRNNAFGPKPTPNKPLSRGQYRTGLQEPHYSRKGNRLHGEETRHDAVQPNGGTEVQRRTQRPKPLSPPPLNRGWGTRGLKETERYT